MSVLVFAHDVANAVKEHRDNGVPLPELVHVLELIAEELIAEELVAQERRQSVIIVKLTNRSKTREI